MRGCRGGLSDADFGRRLGTGPPGTAHRYAAPTVHPPTRRSTSARRVLATSGSHPDTARAAVPPGRQRRDGSPTRSSSGLLTVIPRVLAQKPTGIALSADLRLRPESRSALQTFPRKRAPCKQKGGRAFGAVLIKADPRSSASRLSKRAAATRLRAETGWMTDGREPVFTRQIEPNPIKSSCSSGSARFWPGSLTTDCGCENGLRLYGTGRSFREPTVRSLVDWSLLTVAVEAK
jgi:hypothetical protein